MSEHATGSHDCCAGPAPGGLLPVEEARRRILEQVTPVTTVERVALRDALGRVAARDILSPIDVPAHTNSAMDGYAVRGADLPAEGERALRVVGTALAGAPFDGVVGPGEAVRIMTGAVMPEGADTVVMQEAVRREGETVILGPGHEPGENVRHAGEDLARGGVVIGAGTVFRPAELGVAASVGLAEVPVLRRVRVAFFSTGDELRGIGEPLGLGDVYDSNRYSLYGMLRRLGVELLDLGVIRDDPEAMREAFSEAAAQADVVITSGGVSVGEADYVKQTLDALGEVRMWRIAMKPGKPLAFGRLGGAWFFGLPGNPVSVMVTFYQFVQPALWRMAGARVTRPPELRVPCVSRLRKGRGRTEFQRGILETDAEGRWVVRSTGPQGSGILSSMAAANCFIVLPAGSEGVEPGDEVTVQPFHGLV
ncbi:gephyrin-like molybdotransferase Glp [Inmirania thermothiophila]|uniref:Molybdopterin molybdenumtransferase n=1 Tax=Inmirania thermothiophila TaxID=1750597 RepID=A0A3N1Y1C1_9GAMM|nr:gephyrin-like molybdotransferase Glp [Inmirania thermothiophila]ROR32318.1 molybdopterin molybdochelatase [Inmirania thermothiophila]